LNESGGEVSHDLLLSDHKNLVEPIGTVFHAAQTQVPGRASVPLQKPTPLVQKFDQPGTFKKPAGSFTGPSLPDFDHDFVVEKVMAPKQSQTTNMLPDNQPARGSRFRIDLDAGYKEAINPQGVKVPIPQPLTSPRQPISNPKYQAPVVPTLNQQSTISKRQDEAPRTVVQRLQRDNSPTLSLPQRPPGESTQPKSTQIQIANRVQRDQLTPDLQPPKPDSYHPLQPQKVAYRPSFEEIVAQQRQQMQAPLHPKRASPSRSEANTPRDSAFGRSDSSHLNPRIVRVSRSPVINPESSAPGRTGGANWTKNIQNNIDDSRFTIGALGAIGAPLGTRQGNLERPPPTRHQASGSQFLPIREPIGKDDTDGRSRIQYYVGKQHSLQPTQPSQLNPPWPSRN
jgi:hypothetical protein